MTKIQHAEADEISSDGEFEEGFIVPSNEIAKPKTKKGMPGPDDFV